MLKDRIKELRSKKKWTQAELAKKINVSQQTIGSWEVGRAEPSSDALSTLAKLFEVSVDYLLNGKEGYQKEWSNSFDKPNDMIRTVAAHIDDDATEEDLEDILRYIEYRKNNPLKKKK